MCEKVCKGFFHVFATIGFRQKRPVNAGRQQYRERIEELSTEDFDKTLKTNLYALHWIAQAAVPHMPCSSPVAVESDQTETRLQRFLELSALVYDPSYKGLREVQDNAAVYELD